MNRLYTAEERDALHTAFREMDEHCTQRMREMQWRLALLLTGASASFVVLQMLFALSTTTAGLVMVAIVLVGRWVMGLSTVDLDEDVKRIESVLKRKPGIWREDRPKSG